MKTREKIYNAYTDAEMAHALVKKSAFASLIANEDLGDAKLYEAHEKLMIASRLIEEAHDLLAEAAASVQENAVQ